MDKLAENVKSRRQILEALQAELLGPEPCGKPIEVAPGEKVAVVREELWTPKRQRNGEEILWQDPPLKRYGAGILYPRGVTFEAELAAESEVAEIGAGAVVEAENEASGQTAATPELDKIRSRSGTAEIDAGDDDIGSANMPQPSAMGITFLVDLSAEAQGLTIELVDVRRCGRNDDDVIAVMPAIYTPASMSVHGGDDGREFNRRIWLRVPLLNDAGGPLQHHFSTAELLGARRPIKGAFGTKQANLGFTMVVRPSAGGGARRLITVSVVNLAQAPRRGFDESAVFQAGVRVRSTSGMKPILPYPKISVQAAQRMRPASGYDDEAVNSVLYSTNDTFAVGHGCAADWESAPSGHVSEVWSSTLPVWEIPTTGPDLRIDGDKLTVSMHRLAGLNAADDGARDVDKLVAAYTDWIGELEARLETDESFSGETGRVGREIVARCKNCLARIVEGWAYLKMEGVEGDRVRVAFRAANHAMLLSQLHSGLPVRTPELTAGGIRFDVDAANIDENIADPNIGYWRPFQIAFLLMSLKGICRPEEGDRRVVDLIWFPTGGGKTEAYLGLAAFALLWARLAGQKRSGADVIMRYTLRLLTAQQYQRAAGLFCSLEHLRTHSNRYVGVFGKLPFRIGLWVGGTTTPNSRSDAIHKLRELERHEDAENPFILRRCPWCAAAFTHVGAGRTLRLLGYRREPLVGSADTVVLRCPDKNCQFGESVAERKPPLPVVLVDEDLYEAPPNLVIGTVDKFALLPWKPEARRIFGIGADGWHDGEPPSLIIQDELHLISGPLGSMVGAYEGLIEALCRTHDFKRRPDPASWPKIIASTATISRAYEQIRSLYAREVVSLFPPPGLDAGDSFFARYARNEAGGLENGRMYVGVLAPGHGSLQTTQARVFGTLLQEPALLAGDDSVKDPWWTLVCFFNSLRELGSAGTLFMSDVRDYLGVIAERRGLNVGQRRRPLLVEELTSRIRSDEIPAVLERLERRYSASGKGGAIANDACLASNIIEVGVDIQRLALMCIVGQPKTGSQYIQVSSRVGRRKDCPGLVVVLYGLTKPRDRSHYERFRPDHERLYAQVEPTSVTPFSTPAVERTLHAVLVGAVRQMGNAATEGERPRPCPLVPGNALLSMVENLVRDRARAVLGGGPSLELAYVEYMLKQRIQDWTTRNPQDYGSFFSIPVDCPLMYVAGSTPPLGWHGRSWPMPTSMRDVDATCEAEVTPYFTQPAQG